MENDDQRRVFLAIGLCLLIFVGYSLIMRRVHPPVEAPPEEPVATAPASGQATGAAAGGGQATGGAAASGQPATIAPAPPPETRSFTTSVYDGALSSRPALERFELKKYKEQREEGAKPEPVSLVTAEMDGAMRQALFELELGGAPGPALGFAAGDGLHLHGAREGWEVDIQATPRSEEYALDYVLTAKNTGSAAQKAGATVHLGLAPHAAASQGGWFAPPADLVHGYCTVDGSVERKTAKDVAETPYTEESAAWAGLDRQYFVVALLPAEQQGRCVVHAKDKTVFVDYGFVAADVAPGQSYEKKFTLYLGPKRNADLAAVSADLRDVIDYNIWGIPLGFIARPMVAMLNVFHGWSNSWGVAIILLTLMVKLLTFPVTYKSSLSMKRMQLVKPELDKLKAKYENDRERLQMEQLKLFKEKGVNPVGGCLPMLLQMPIWLALYRSLWSAVDLYEQPFLWISNLTARETFPFLALACGGLMILQQKMQPTTMDSQQAKIMLWVMPVVFTFFMINSPSGLVLYIVVNSILTIVQQLVINRRPIAQ